MDLAKNGLLFEDKWWAADALSVKVDRHFDAICDLDEGYAAVHSELLAVECHRPLDCA
jgi:hypothetical protein